MVTVSAAWAVVNDNPTVMPAASATIFFIRKLQKLKEPAESGSVGWMPESGRALGQRDKPVKRHSCNRGESDFRPHHIERHASCFRRDAKADALGRGAEEFRDDRRNGVLR